MADARVVRVGTRRSPLARTQAAAVVASLQAAHPHLHVKIIPLQTIGDRKKDLPLSALGSPGAFVREVQRALLDDEIDFAVHSGKDLPSQQPAGLVLAAFPPREDPRDALVLATGSPATPAELDLKDLAHQPFFAAGWRLGTSSVRRTAVLRHYQPQLQVLPVRGNVDTRVGKLDAGEFDALILAAAGLKRLGRGDRISSYIKPRQMIPAVAQGTLAVEARADDEELLALLQAVNHQPTEIVTRAERAFLRALAGTCLIPMGAHGSLAEDEVLLHGFVADDSGAPFLADEVRGAATEPETVGLTLAERLLAAGADKIVARYREASR